MVVTGGIVPAQALAEIRIAFINGQFIATSVLAQIILEHLFAGLFSLIGRDEHERLGFAKLSELALREGYITQEEFHAFTELRERRNPYSHSRSVMADGTVERRIISDNLSPDDVFEDDAKIAVQTVFGIMSRRPFACPADDDYADPVGEKDD